MKMQTILSTSTIERRNMHSLESVLIFGKTICILLKLMQTPFHLPQQPQLPQLPQLIISRTKILLTMNALVLHLRLLPPPKLRLKPNKPLKSLLPRPLRLKLSLLSLLLKPQSLPPTLLKTLHQLTISSCRRLLKQPLLIPLQQQTNLFKSKLRPIPRPLLTPTRNTTSTLKLL